MLGRRDDGFRMIAHDNVNISDVTLEGKEVLLIRIGCTGTRDCEMHRSEFVLALEKHLAGRKCCSPIFLEKVRGAQTVFSLRLDTDSKTGWHHWGEEHHKSR